MFAFRKSSLLELFKHARWRMSLTDDSHLSKPSCLAVPRRSRSVSHVRRLMRLRADIGVRQYGFYTSVFSALVFLFVSLENL